MSCPGSISLNTLKNTGVGQTYEVTSGCCPSIVGAGAGSGLAYCQSKGLSWPNNGEFSFGGLGNQCSMDAFNYGCAKQGGIIGQHATILRNNFGADITKCCTTASSNVIIDNLTCNPDSKKFSKDFCDATMQTYCSQNNYANTASRACQDWAVGAVTAGRPVANNIMSTYCSQGNNYTNDACQGWVSAVRNNSTMRGAADIAITAYCQNNSGDPNCGCMNPPQNVTSIENLMTSSKACWYKPCQNLNNDNYITSTLKDAKDNCVSTVCQINAGDIQVSGSGNAVNFTNSCATQILKPQFRPAAEGGSVPISETPQEGTQHPSQETQSHTTRNIIIGIVICLFLLLLLGGIIFAATR